MRDLPPNYQTCEQRTGEWFQARAGCVTASRVADAVSTRAKGDDMTKRRLDYLLEIAYERLFEGHKLPTHYVNEWMERGTVTEPSARLAYELDTGEDVQPIGLVYHPTIKYFAASPDGLIGTDGTLELKCPKWNTHMGYIWKQTVPSDYRKQVLAHLACCVDREFTQFASYCSDMPLHGQLFKAPRLYRSQVQDEIAELEDKVKAFLVEAAEVTAELKAIMEGKSITEIQLEKSIALVKKRKKRQKQEHVLSAEDRQYIHDQMVP